MPNSLRCSNFPFNTEPFQNHKYFGIAQISARKSVNQNVISKVLPQKLKKGAVHPRIARTAPPASPLLPLLAFPHRFPIFFPRDGIIILCQIIPI